MQDKSKIIIHNYSDLGDYEAISYVRAVISEGKISNTKQGEQYAFVTEFKQSNIVVCSGRHNNTYTFTVERRSHE